MDGPLDGLTDRWIYILFYRDAINASNKAITISNVKSSLNQRSEFRSPSLSYYIHYQLNMHLNILVLTSSTRPVLFFFYLRLNSLRADASGILQGRAKER